MIRPGAPSGAHCTLSFVNVKGDVRVGRNATLFVAGYAEPATIGGNIEAQNCNTALLTGNVTVGGTRVTRHSVQNRGPAMATAWSASTLTA